MLLSDRLVSLRKSNRKTQKDMADILQLERSTYGKYELGSIQPPIEMVNALADYYGVTTDYLLGKSEYPTTTALLEENNRLRVENINLKETVDKIFSLLLRKE